jgi:hypothetical protein
MGAGFRMKRGKERETQQRQEATNRGGEERQGEKRLQDLLRILITMMIKGLSSAIPASTTHDDHTGRWCFLFAGFVQHSLEDDNLEVLLFSLQDLCAIQFGK